MFKKNRQLISLVIPAYNDEINLPIIYNEIKNILLSNKSYDFEIIFVNDGSADDTWSVIKQLCIKSKLIKGINLSRNFGHQGSLTAGLELANGDAVISMDSDGQDPVSVAKEMIEKWEQGYEVVYGRRVDRNDTIMKKYTAILYYKLLSIISDTEIPRNVGDFRLIDRKVLNAFLSLKEKDRYIRGMFAWLGFKTGFVDFNRPEREHGESGYTIKKLLTLATDGILSFSMFPLRIGFIIGNIMILLSFLFLSFMLIQTVLSGDIYFYQLYKWISVVGFGVMGLQFVFIWILGEYIGRIYNEVRERPVYIISDTRNINQ